MMKFSWLCGFFAGMLVDSGLLKKNQGSPQI